MKIRGILFGIMLTASTIYAGCNNVNANTKTATQNKTTEVITRQTCDYEINTTKNFQRMQGETNSQITCARVLKECKERLKKLKKLNAQTIEETCLALKNTCLGDAKTTIHNL